MVLILCHLVFADNHNKSTIRVKRSFVILDVSYRVQPVITLSIYLIRARSGTRPVACHEPFLIPHEVNNDATLFLGNEGLSVWEPWTLQVDCLIGEINSRRMRTFSNHKAVIQRT